MPNQKKLKKNKLIKTQMKAIKFWRKDGCKEIKKKIG
jgi:hypothetical protein